MWPGNHNSPVRSMSQRLFSKRFVFGSRTCSGSWSSVSCTAILSGVVTRELPSIPSHPSHLFPRQFFNLTLHKLLEKDMFLKARTGICISIVSCIGAGKGTLTSWPLFHRITGVSQWPGLPDLQYEGI